MTFKTAFRSVLVALLLAVASTASAQIPGLPNLIGTSTKAAGESAPAEVPADRAADIAALDRILSLLGDDTARAAFLEDLRRLRTSLDVEGPSQPAQASVEEGGLIGALLAAAEEAASTIPNAALGAPLGTKLADAQSEIVQRLETGFGGEETLTFLGWGLPGVALTIGLMAALFRSSWLTRRRMVKTRPTTHGALWRKVPFKALFGLVPPAAAILASIVWSAWFSPDWRQAQIFIAMTAPFITGVLARQIVYYLLMALGLSRGWRLVAYSQRRLLPWIGVLVGLGTFAGFLREFAVRLVLGRNVSDLLALGFDILVALLALVFVLRHRPTVRSLLLKGRARGSDGQAAGILANVLKLFADYWHVFALLFITANVASRVLGFGGGNFFAEGSIAVIYVLGALGLLSLANSLFAKAADALTQRRPSTRKAVLRRYLDVAHLLLQILVAATVTIACIDLWRFDLWGWLTTEEGLRLVRPALSLLMVPIVIWVIWITIDTVIENALAPTDYRGRQRHQSGRVKTLLPLLRNLVFVALTVVTVIAVLANLGVNVVPLLAGAGVIGLAFSFGSQQLVQDVITGFFILFEDTIAIGDSINTGDRSGVVEGLNIRTVKIRDGAGALHSVPFSQIKALRNDSRDFSVYQLALTIGYESDPDEAMELMRQVGAELRSDFAYGQDILAPLEIWGVDGFTPQGVVVKGAIRCRPLQQWPVGREFNRRLKKRFDKAGITFFTPWQKMQVEQIPAEETPVGGEQMRPRPA